MKRLFLVTQFALLMQFYAATQNIPVTIAGSQVRKITSSIVPQQDYELHIMLPGGYANSNRLFPVLYLLDSQWDFPLLTSLYGQQYFDGFVPPMIIVGITWTGRYSNADSLRARDYTPTHQTRIPQSGGAANFLSFMKNELFPFIESNYKADKTNRTLMGCSFGGLFALYALFAEPELFGNYVAASPAIGWDNNMIYQLEKKYFENASRSSARLYMCEGGVERGVASFESFVQHLVNRNYKSLQISAEVLKNIGHVGTKGVGFSYGLQHAFKRPEIKLTEAQLKSISGNYKSQDGTEMEIKTEDGSPVLYLNGNNQYILYAAGKNELYSTAEFLNLHLKVDDDEKISGLELEQYNRNRFFLKMK